MVFEKTERFNHGSVPKQRLLQALFRIHRPIGVIKLDIIEDNREFESLWGEKTALNINIKKVRLETLYRCRLARHRVKSLENQILNSKLGPIKLKWFHFLDILTFWLWKWVYGLIDRLTESWTDRPTVYDNGSFCDSRLWLVDSQFSESSFWPNQELFFIIFEIRETPREFLF